MEVRTPAEGSTTLAGYHTIHEAAKLLGCSEAALYSRIYRGEYEVVKAGRTILLSDEMVMRLYTEVRRYQYGDQK